MNFNSFHSYFGRGGNYISSDEDNNQIKLLNSPLMLDILYIYGSHSQSVSNPTINALRNLRHRVVVTAKLTDALHSLQTKRFDLVLIDLEKTESVMQISHMIRTYKHNNNPNVPIIAVSKIVTDTIRYECKGYGVTDMILPTTDLKKLQETLYQFEKKFRTHSGF